MFWSLITPPNLPQARNRLKIKVHGSEEGQVKDLFEGLDVKRSEHVDEYLIYSFYPHVLLSF